MSRELEDVEQPFVARLQALGWTHVAGSLDDPAVTGRTGFAEVIQEPVLRERLRALNPGPDGSGSEIETAARFGKSGLSEQERLIAGLLQPAHLLDVVQHFLLFMQVGGQTIKAVCRYQQYRAVNRALARLRTGQTRVQHGEHDQRGGIVWHTQGSGKSLTMVFLVRKMRADSSTKPIAPRPATCMPA